MTAAADLSWLCPACGAALAPRPDALECPRCSRSLAIREGIVEAAPGFVPDGFAPARRDHLETLASGHFWFPPRNRLLARLVASELPAPGARFARALELGCGTGPFLAPLARLAAERVGLDAYRESLVAARDRAEGALLVQGDVLSVPLAAGQFDLLLALDVLEHVAPGPFLREAARLGTEEARLAVSVPASPRLWSDLDHAAGHRRRYTRRALVAELAAAGWRVTRHAYYQALLYPLLWLSRRAGTGRLRRAERQPSRAAGAALGSVNALEVRLGRWIPWGWGSSLLAIARRESVT